MERYAAQPHHVPSQVPSRELPHLSLEFLDTSLLLEDKIKTIFISNVFICPNWMLFLTNSNWNAEEGVCRGASAPLDLEKFLFCNHVFL